MIKTKKHQIIMNIFFHKIDGDLLKINLYPSGSLLEKDFTGTGRIAIDSHRYVQLLLNMVDNYEIIKLEVEKKEDH